MEKYKVVKSFKDLEDNNFMYGAPNGLYPREGLEVSQDRINEIIKAGYIEKLEVEDDVQSDGTEVTQSPNEDWTIDEIKEYLDHLEIEYKARDSKGTLLELAGV